jgi:hypothetical protein
VTAFISYKLLVELICSDIFCLYDMKESDFSTITFIFCSKFSLDHSILKITDLVLRNVIGFARLSLLCLHSCNLHKEIKEDNTPRGYTCCAVCTFIV